MNTKNKLIEKLLETAKKHKILTYPVLAVVAVLSVFHYFFSWSTGAGKRVIAVIMVLVMLVSQSYFLTSSATALVDTEEDVKVQQELQEQESEGLIDSSDAQQDSSDSESLIDVEENTEQVIEDEDAEDSVNSEEEDTSSETSESGGETVDLDNVTSEITEEGMDDSTTESNVYLDDISTETGEWTSENIPVFEEEEPEIVTDTPSVETTTVLFAAYKEGANNLSTVYECSATKNADGTYSISETDIVAANEHLGGFAVVGYTAYDGWYANVACSGSKADMSSLSPNMGTGIWLYAKKSLLKYKVTIDAQGGTILDDSVTGATKNVTPEGAVYFDVPVVNGVHEATFTISNPKRVGYKVSGATGDCTASAVDGVLTVTVSGETYAKNIVLQWKPGDFNFYYAAHDGVTGKFEHGDTEYDDEFALFKDATEEIKSAKLGYKFIGWTVNDGTQDYFVEAGKSIKAYTDVQSYLFKQYLNDAPVTLTAKYEYAGIELATPELSYEYRIPNSDVKIIKGVYVGTDTTGDFYYDIKNIVVDGVDVDEATLNSEYGIDVVEIQDSGIQVRTVSEGPKKVPSGPIALELQITDNNADEGENVTTQTFYINIMKCQLKLDMEDSITKVYDGTNVCSFSGEIGTNVSGVKVNVVSSVYDDVNAGERRVILTLSESAPYTVPDGDSPNNYELVAVNGEYSVAGTITKRPVNIVTRAVIDSGRGYVRTGEKNPTFVADVVDTGAADSGFVGEDAEHIYDFLSLNPDPERNDAEMLTSNITTKQYRVWPTEKEGSNYKFSIDSLDGLGTFDVRLESPATLYDISETNDSGWHGPGATIAPKSDSGYDRIYLTTGQLDGNIILNEENTAGDKITFQLQDTVTGAYTSYLTIPVYVDLTKPEYIDYEMSVDGYGSDYGLYFPSEGGLISFGHYFNKTITFTIKYKDTHSQPYKLYYTLSNTLGGTAGVAKQEAVFATANVNGEAVAQFEIVAGLVDRIGTIQFYAEDKAGNVSEIMALEKDGEEWAVEQSGPQIGELILKSGGYSATDGVTVSSGNNGYYANCRAYLHAEDATSGIYSVTWIVNGVEYEELVGDVKKYSMDFATAVDDSKFPSDESYYEISAYVTDNAGNKSLCTDTITFRVDDEDPVVDVIEDYDVYAPVVKLKFSAFDELSGVKYINVKDKETGEMIQHVVEDVEDGLSDCYVETSRQGTYVIVVSDNAGNTVELEIVLDKVSDEVPECPEISISPEVLENGWITDENATLTIYNVQETPENRTPAATRYQLWKNGETSLHITTLADDAEYEEVSLESGNYILRVWSETQTGVVCDTGEEDAHMYTIKVDAIAPVIEYQLAKNTGNSLLINFTVKDDISGVDGESIQIMHGTQPMTVQLVELEDGTGYSGSFEIAETGNYAISAKDIAGNEAHTEAFTPMSMKVNAIKNVSTSSATVGAVIRRGTYPIKSASIAYRKYVEEGFVEADAFLLQDEETGDVTISATLSDMKKGTAYVYKITAVSESDEVLEYVGYFRTLSDDEKGIIVSGTARYADSRDGFITIGLFEGNSCIRAVEVDTSEENTFSFNNIPDGNYSVVATDGTYSKTKRILIKDGMMIYPESGNIDLVLSGLNTSVEITSDETPNVTADNMDSLFADSTNFTETNQNLVADGKGTVEFKLYATLMHVSDVEAAAISAMYEAATSKDKLVGAYLDLSLYKIVTDQYGAVTKTIVHEIGGGSNVSVTVPLGDMAGKSGLEVIRIHQDGDVYTGAYLIDQDKNPATYTVTTSQFSTYAILYDPEKTEVPEATTTTEESFVDITTEETTQLTITEGTLDPAANGSFYKTTEEPIPADDPDDKNDKNDKDKDKGTGKDKNNSSGGASVGSLKSSGSAKTGDGTPIGILFGLMLISCGGVVYLRKKEID